MKFYLVGGAVRDNLLELPVRDRDWVVVGGTAKEMLARGFKQRNADFPVFLHPQSGEEYALARREIKTASGYKGFKIEADADVTLEEDLRRRDLTINAIAQDQNGTLIDPFNGREDLQQGLLRHVSPAFVEDPVRVLRVARFAARLGRWGFRLSHGTQALLRQIVASGELSALSGERLWNETKRALAEDQPWRFPQVLKRCGALAQLLPTLDSRIPDAQSHSGEDEHGPLHALQRAAVATTDPAVRFAALFYPGQQDGAEGGSATDGLPVEKRFADLLALATRWVPCYPQPHRADASGLLELLEGCRALKDDSQLQALTVIAESLDPCQRDSGILLNRARSRISGISSAGLAADGLSGKALGEALRELRLRAIATLLEENDIPGESQ